VQALGKKNEKYFIVFDACGRLILALQAARGNASKPGLPVVGLSFPLPCSVFAS
jgi:hypothetical protein